MKVGCKERIGTHQSSSAVEISRESKLIAHILWNHKFLAGRRPKGAVGVSFSVLLRIAKDLMRRGDPIGKSIYFIFGLA